MFIKVAERHEPEAIGSGRALGIDLGWAWAAKEMGIPLVAAVPIEG